MFSLLTLPFRIVFGLFFGLLALPFAFIAMPFALVGIVLFLPFLLLRFVIKAAVGLVMLPVVLLLAGIVCAALLVAAAVAILIPLSPLLLIGFIVWAVTRNSRAAIAVRG
jgi:hypothetical protein